MSKENTPEIEAAMLDNGPSKADEQIKRVKEVDFSGSGSDAERYDNYQSPALYEGIAFVSAQGTLEWNTPSESDNVIKSLTLSLDLQNLPDVDPTEPNFSSLHSISYNGFTTFEVLEGEAARNFTLSKVTINGQPLAADVDLALRTISFNSLLPTDPVANTLGSLDFTNGTLLNISNTLQGQGGAEGVPLDQRVAIEQAQDETGDPSEADEDGRENITSKSEMVSDPKGLTTEQYSSFRDNSILDNTAVDRQDNSLSELLPKVNTTTVAPVIIDNIAPSFTSGGTASVAENINDATVIYNGVVNDPDTTGTITYSLQSDVSGLFEINSTTGEVTLINGLNLDHETAASHDITVRASDGTNTTDQNVTITVTDINETPTDLTFTAASPSISSGVISGGTVIGTATGVDQDISDTQTYSLTDDAAGLFKIDSSTGQISILGDTANLAEVTGASNPFNGVDVGNLSNPTFADLDNDGDLDAFIGEDLGTIIYYENTGTNSAPTFVNKTGADNPLDGIDVGFRAAPTFADLDNDGDLDLMIGGFDTEEITYFENTGTNSSPTFVEKTGSDSPFDNLTIPRRATPTFVDIDNDGDLDMFLGDTHGTIEFFENTGTNSAPTFVQKTGSDNPFDGVDEGQRSVITFVDIDNDGDQDAFIGERNDGVINFYENTGTEASATFTERTGADNPLNISLGSESAPTFADIDNDGDMDAFIGEWDGNINFYQNNSDFDASSATTSTITVQTEDAGGLTYSEDLTVQTGTTGNDTITGDANSGIVFGFDGDDTINGSGGSDIIDGGLGTDTVDYSASSAGVNINLSTNVATGGDAEGDTFNAIENITASALADNITGDSGDNTIRGNSGNDVLAGGDGNDLFIFLEGDGTDTVDGGSGVTWTDRLQLLDSAGGDNLGTYGTDWTVNLTSGSITVGSDKLSLGQDADGTVTLQDGSKINFTDIEEILF